MEGRFDKLVGARLIDGADGFPEALATVKSHGAKAKVRDQKAGVS
jgi:hypothetical protein